MINNIVFDATQAEVAYRIDTLYEARRTLRRQKRRGIRWFSRRPGAAQRPVQEQVRAPAPVSQTARGSAVNQPQPELAAKEKSEVSVG